MDAGSSASGRPPVAAAVAAAEDTMAVAVVAVQEGARLERTLRKRMAWCGAHFTSGSGSFFTSGSGSQVYNLSAYYYCTVCMRFRFLGQTQPQKVGRKLPTRQMDGSFSAHRTCISTQAFPVNRQKQIHFHREFTPILDLFLPILKQETLSI